jgi:hypothetical protein
MAAQPTHKLLIIDESVLLGMAGNPTFVKEFPFLKSLAQMHNKKSTGCGRCNRSAQRRVTQVNGVKQSIVTMGAERKQRLKKMLNAEKVRVRVANAGKVSEYTF